jgi:adenosylmethionine-8-amino-7-oxononanoate aminotransferase
VALANLAVFKKDKTLSRLQAKIKTMARRLQPLWQLPQVGDIRQRGFIAAIELVEDKTTRKPYPIEARIGHRVCRVARQNGLVLRPLGHIILLIPPLSTTVDELTRMIDILSDSIESLPGN